MITSPASPSGAAWYRSAAAEETKQVLAGPGLLYAAVFTNSNAAARYIYLFDSLTATGVPVLPPVPVPAGGQVVVALPFPIACLVGLFFASSSTNATYTASATSDLRASLLTKG